MKTNHTPGPWKEGRPGTVVANIEHAEPEDIKTGHSDFEYYGGLLICESIRTPNDSKLISCAPELLLSLKSLVDWAAHLPQLANEDIAKAKELIKKATK